MKIVQFLIRRPIAVTMTFIAILVLGIAAINYIPISLMPDIDIPEITVQLNVKNNPARELENSVVKPIRRQLMQSAHLTDITSETSNETSTIHLKFEYGTDVDFAFIEVNEKIDRAMNYLPREIERPKVIKASATDIPVFYLNLTLKSQKSEVRSQKSEAPNSSNGAASNPSNISNELFPVSHEFAELSNFSSNVIRKRIEQLSEVAMVDVSGLVYSELLILPDSKKMEALGISQEMLENSIKKNNVKLGSLLIRDGQYQYNIRFSSSLQDKRDIENVYLKVDKRLLQLKDIAQVIEHPQKQKGKVTSNGKDAITMAVIKQSDARMSDLEKKLNSLLFQFGKDYPNIDFKVTRNQTTLLDYSMSNLGQNLVWGSILAILIMFLFLKDFKAPMLIAITIPTSLVISMLFFYLFGISINIISLSGIILGVGMMVDNSIIVIDNITQHRQRAKSAFKPSNPSNNRNGANTSSSEALDLACINATNEVFTPMLSSVLTTCAVFIPLIFISGIAGALFYDQAITITVGLLVSLAVSVTLLPVYYRLVYRKGTVLGENRFLSRINKINYEEIYEVGFRWAMRRQAWVWLLVVLMLGGTVVLFYDLESTKLPVIARDEIVLNVDWNEQINLNENNRRVTGLVISLGDKIEQNTCLVGEQQFIMDKNNNMGASGSMVYLKVKNSAELDQTILETENYLRANYPSSLFRFSDAGNIFNTLFPDSEKPLTAKLRATEESGQRSGELLLKTLEKLRLALPEQIIEQPAMTDYSILHTDPEKLMLYDIPFELIYAKLRSAFNENQVFLISDNQNFVPVVLGGKPEKINTIINTLFLRNRKNELIPVRSLLSETHGQDLKSIVAGQEGEYYPVNFDIKENQATPLMGKIRDALQTDRSYEVSYTGSIFSNKKLMGELTIILLISLSLLYFILAAQFESLVLPLIILIEVPIDLFGALLALKIGGAGINLMSLIGIVVMSGIIVNDSILKVDTINQLIKEGNGLIRAMSMAGQRRLKPILMTSLTTILALVPTLFSNGMGADLQRPLALTIIGGMILGTLVSLYVVPVCYYYIMKTKTIKP